MINYLLSNKLLFVTIPLLILGSGIILGVKYTTADKRIFYRVGIGCIIIALTSITYPYLFVSYKYTYVFIALMALGGVCISPYGWAYVFKGGTVDVYLTPMRTFFKKGSYMSGPYWRVRPFARKLIREEKPIISCSQLAITTACWLIFEMSSIMIHISTYAENLWRIFPSIAWFALSSPTAMLGIQQNKIAAFVVKWGFYFVFSLALFFTIYGIILLV